jgi:predicted alpha/beta-hydrolase family hydrolase
VPEELQLQVGEASVSAILERPRFARALMVLAHGAGAGMRHQFMEAIVEALSVREIATLRYQFPYIERRTFRPDPRPVLLATVEAAMAAGQVHAGTLPLLAGGKSMGGRMTSMAAAEGRLPHALRGIVFFGFPLHPAGRPGRDRAEHLPEVPVPTLFLQGTRDKLAELDLLTPIVDALPRGRMHIVDGADHGFHMLKRSGRTDAEALEEVADAASAFVDEMRA